MVKNSKKVNMSHTLKKVTSRNKEEEEEEEEGEKEEEEFVGGEGWL
jgi:hypothetical protein